MQIVTVYVVGTFPDHLNTNQILRDYLAEGMREALPLAQVVSLDITRFLAIARPVENEITVFIGSVLMSDVAVEAAFEIARRGGGKAAVWLHDDPYEFDAHIRAVGNVDVIFTNDRASVYHYPTTTRVEHLPLAASRRHLEVEICRNGHDLNFVGVAYSNRLQLFKELKQILDCRKENWRLIVIGPDWPEAKFDFVFKGRVDNESLMKLYGNSTSTLYLGRAFDLANNRFRIRPSTPGPRLFEAAGSGGCQIVMTPGLEVLEYYSDGDEILYADNVEVVVDHLIHLKRDPERSVDLGKRARKRTISEHLYVHRARKIISILNQT